jgi:prevent-host-death family protein
MEIAIRNSYNGDMKVSVADAKNKLPELIKAAENGERITICRRGKPVVDLVRTAKSAMKKPKFDTLRGKVIIHDPDWWKPMTDEEVDAFLEGRY